MKRNAKVVGSVAIYGTSRVGHGFIAVLGAGIGGPMFGDGLPLPEHSATDALFRGVERLRRAGATSGVVEVYRQEWPSRSFVARTRVEAPAYFGDLKWEEAPPAVVISAEEIESMAERG